MQISRMEILQRMVSTLSWIMNIVIVINIHCCVWLIVAEEGNDEVSFNSLTDDLENESKKMISYKHDYNYDTQMKDISMCSLFF